MKLNKTIIILAAVLILGVLVYTTCTAQVPTGYTGILTTFGRVESYTLDAGFHFKSPFQNVVLMDNREQKTSFRTQSFSSVTSCFTASTQKSTSMGGMDMRSQELFMRLKFSSGRNSRTFPASSR